MSGRLAGKSVVITGASSGNGRAIAYEMARHGANVALAARRGIALEQVAHDCRRLGGEALAIETDVAAASAITALAQAAVDRFGTIDVWVNCAAVLQFGRIEETPTDLLERVLATNVLGYVHGAQTAIRQFRQQGHGTLINIGSVLGITAQPFATAYVTSKAAILGLSEGLRQELVDERNVHVCTVLPYAIDTPIYQRAANYLGREVRPVWPRYAPETVAKVTVRLVTRPRPKAYAGGLARFAALLRLLPEPLRARVIRRAIEAMQIRREVRSPTAGNVFEPIHDEWTVNGGWRRQDEAKEEGPPRSNRERGNF